MIYKAVNGILEKHGVHSENLCVELVNLLVRERRTSKNVFDCEITNTAIPGRTPLYLNGGPPVYIK